MAGDDDAAAADAAMEMEYGSQHMSGDSGSESSLDTVAEQEQAKSDLAKQENADVSRWRFAVAIMLTITSGVVLAFTYSFMSRAEEDEFKASFEQSTSTVIAASRFYAFNVLNTFEGMTDTITSRALRNGSTWPYVVVEDFELAGAHARVTSFTEAVFFAPLVFGPFRQEWEEWAANRTEWIEESRSYADLTRSWLAEEDFYSGESVGSSPGPCRSCSGSSTIEEDFIRDETLSPRRGSGEIFAIEESQAETCLLEPPCQLTRDRSRAIYAPVWQMSPPPSDPVAIGFNLFSNTMMSRIVSVLINSEVRSIITGLVDVQLLHAGIWSDEEHANFHAGASDENGQNADPMKLPHSVVVTSIYSKLVGSANNRIVGFVAAIIPWDGYFSRLLPPGVNGIYAVVESTCDSVSTYVINGPTATFLGNDDMHEKEFDHTRKVFDFNIFVSSSEDGVFKGDESTRPCEYTLNLYASKVYRQRFHSSQATIFMLVLGSVFIVTGAVFVMFLRYVGRRQAVVVETAMRTNAIVASLFPSNVRDRVLESNENSMHNSMSNLGARQRLKNFMNGEVEDEGNEDVTDLKSKPIADLFPETTIMFCDMVGFTAWSSSRAPTDVFGLLEKVYGAFDERAKKRKVFKVETVGDQYVAVTGLPQPMKDHAVVCCRFAAECSLILDALVKELEVEFGPDTADLNMRFGLHSGPVTAGVLRGERSRFQLFGDTVNTASRLESTGLAGKIQVSEETAALLRKAGKGRWLRPREQKVTAKGKGELSTYWLERHDDSITSTKSMAMVQEDGPASIAHDMVPVGSLTDRSARLVDYNVDVLLRLLKKIECRRRALRIQKADVQLDFERLDGHTVLEEVQETIALPAFNARASGREVDPSQIDLGSAVEHELQHYVATIASLYNDNPFHNFEHVSHVAMSVAKLMSRIVAPEMEGSEGRSRVRAHKLHDNTYGITSDPLTQFACVFSALIHDVDHLGVPNTQLVLEQPELAKMYKNKSVAEQHSVDLSWKLLMEPFYHNLQKAIFSTPEEYRRFRQLVVNSVMATDIMDPDLKKLRNKRWEKAFATNNQGSMKQEDINRKATIVIEHLIQASDVSHTMQHWHIYRKWNERLFEEMYKAHLLFRSGTNPADNWAESEIGFFDYYIIPLAKKLNDCGVFGVSSFEYLDYAQRNRDEWKVKGEQIVAEMVQSVNDKLFQRQEI